MIVQSLFGLLVFTALAWILGENRKKARWQDAALGISAQFILALLLLKFPYSQALFVVLNKAVMVLEDATLSGTSFVFGYLGGGNLPFDEKYPGSTFVLALQALPIVLVVSALSSLLFYWKVLPLIVKSFSFLLEKTFGLGGALGLGAAANIFVGMVEAPLFVRPYLHKMTRSELFSIMTCGMATIAGTVMVLYASILRDVIPDTMGHIIAASLISAPAALAVSRLMIPETSTVTSGLLSPVENATSSMDAITSGTLDGLKLLLNIVAMLIVLVALVSLVNTFLGLLPDIGNTPLTLQGILGYLMAPVAWLMGIPWEEASAAGSLIGTKTVLNELLAYLDLSRLPEGALSMRSKMIMTYALCGFANFGSLGITIGGLGSIAPERRREIVSLGIKSIIAGTIATCMTGSVAGALYMI